MSEQRDLSGTVYNSPTNGPAPSGTPVTIPTNGGVKPGHMVGGHAVEDRK